jgi:hypothetical protein
MGISKNKGSACSQPSNENHCKPFVERDFRVTFFVPSYGRLKTEELEAYHGFSN